MSDVDKQALADDLLRRAAEAEYLHGLVLADIGDVAQSLIEIHK